MEDIVYLTRCAINGIKPARERAELMDLDQLYRASVQHSLSAAIAYALEDAGVSSDAFAQAKAKAIRKSILLDHERAALLERLDGAGIWYTPLKGSVLKDLYPRVGMRQMADNDILFDASRCDEVRSIMEGLGFRTVEYGTGHHDHYEKPPVSNFEMHRVLFTDARGDALYDYYRDVKGRLIKDRGNACGWHFSDEDFYVYMVAHEHKHYSSFGTGLRSLLDTYVYCRRRGDTLDWDYIVGEVGKLGIADFERESRGLAVRLFGGEELTGADRRMLDVVLESGTYGNSSVYARRQVEEKGRLGFLLPRAFPPMRVMKWQYPVLRKAPVLLPACWVARLVRTAWVRPWKIVRELGEVFGGR